MSSASTTPDGGHSHSSSVSALVLGAIGVVFGDIGTSPLYAMHETFGGHHALPLDKPHVLGVLSLMFWALIIVVSLKYVIVLMRADNRGEGGSLALLALVGQAAKDNPRLVAIVATLGIFDAALFYGDSMITPAISVLSAVEGIQVVAPAMSQWIIPATLVILVLLFTMQSHGTDTMGTLFGPVMVTWFVVLMVLGIRNIGLNPVVLKAFSPHYAILFLAENGLTGFLALGSVVLAVTGAEALYADMGHFGRLPIRLAWYGLVLPSLVLNYFGQGALLLAHPEAVDNPFIRLAPSWAGIPLLILSTCATIIASQAVISGAFSVTRQAIQLGYLPRMEIIHTSAKEIGQIYIPFLNWMLAGSVLALVIGFKSSSNLAAAYGVAVTGSMVISSILLSLVMSLLWGWKGRKTALLLIVFFVVDLGFFLSNVPKIPFGGWFPLAVAIAVFVLLTSWKRGRTKLLARLQEETMPVDLFLTSVSSRVHRVSGTAIFLTSTSQGIPIALLHNLKHNKVLHERVIILTVKMEDIPFVSDEHNLKNEPLGDNIHRLTLRFGFMQDPNIPKALAKARSDQLGFFYEPMSISYFLSRETIIPSGEDGPDKWREYLFSWMARSATSAMDFFHLPCNRVVELGSQIEI